MIHACIGGHAGAANLLLERKADPDAASRDASTALHAAAEHGALECAALLLRGGARPDAQDAAGLTPLGLAERSAGGSLRHLATLELLESFGDGEDLTGEVLSASGAVQNLPGPRAVLDVLSELKWQPAGVALQAHEAAGVRKPRPFSQAAGEGTTQSSFEHKVPRVVLERIYRRQRRDSGQRAELAAADAVRLPVQPDVISTTGAAWPAEVFDRLTAAQAPERLAPHVAASKRKEPHGARVRRVLDAETPTFTDVLAAVALATDMRRGRIPAAALPPNALPALVARAVEQLTAQLSQASNGDDVEEMGRVLQSVRSGKGELTAAMGGAELQRSVGEALQTAVHECEARRAACRSAHRKLHAAWRAGDPSGIERSIVAAEALSLPQTTGNDAAPGPLAHLARDFKARHKGLRDAQDLLCEACARISDGVPINADALAHARDVIGTCVRYEATAKSREFAQLSAAVAEIQAMAEAGKENRHDGRSAGNQDGKGEKGGRPPLRTARARRDREAKALQARRSVEVSRYASGRARAQRTEARHQRAREKRGEMAQTEEQRLEELAASATTGDRARASTDSAERTARLAAYHERRDKAVRTKEQLRETAVAAAVASSAARDRQAEEHRARLAAQRQANAAARAQRKSISPRASVQRSAGVVDPIGASGGEPVEVKGSAAFLTTSREQRESSVVVFRGGANRTGAQPFFYSRSVGGGDHRDSGDADGETETTERAGGWRRDGSAAARRVGGRALRLPGRRQRKESQG